MCRLSRNSGASTSWNPVGPLRPVEGKLYLYRRYKFRTTIRERKTIEINKNKGRKV
jgi:hypothetical protein